MAKMFLGVGFGLTGILAFGLGTMMENSAALSGLHHVTGAFWGTALVLFLWFIHEQKANAS
jgi:hypothetical protein